MRPAVGLLSVPTGKPNGGVLKMLKTSVRNCSNPNSLRAKFFSSEKSKFTSPGALKVLRPRLPKVYGAGMANAAVLNQAWRVGLARVGFPTRFGRQVFRLPGDDPVHRRRLVAGHPAG